MLKIGAKAILGVMSTGLLALAAWAGNAIITNKAEISALKAEKIHMHEDIKEIKKDVKSILRSL